VAIVKTWTQGHFRWFQDNGGPSNPNNSSAYGPEDRSAVFYPLKNIRIRIAFSAATAPSSAFYLRYSEDDGAYLDLPTIVGANHVYLSDSPNFTNRAATTQRLTDLTGNWVPGQAMDTSIATTSMSTNSSNTELEWCIMFAAAAIGHKYNFRCVTSIGASSWNYLVTPTIRIYAQQTLIIEDEPLIVEDEPLIVCSSGIKIEDFYTGTYTWVCPADVKSVLVELRAGGGNGYNGALPFGLAGGGGGGGEYARKQVSVTPGSSYIIVAGSSAQNSTFDGTTVVAKKGSDGAAGSGGLGGTGGTGDVTYNGGNGGNGNTGTLGGGGGGGAGDAGAGGNATGTWGEFGGVGGTSGGGSGGNSMTDGNDFGGGGGGRTSSAAGAGPGGKGKATLTYYV
jgi:hypothetical protein